MVKCQTCGKVHEKRTEAAFYCTPSCKQRAYRIRAKARRELLARQLAQHKHAAALQAGLVEGHLAGEGHQLERDDPG